MHIGFWWGDLMERHHLEDQGVDGNITLKIDLNLRSGMRRQGLN
jgi:hypothetical protein